MTQSPLTAALDAPDPRAIDVPHRASLLIRLVNLIAIVVPFMGLLAAGVLLWGHGFNWIYLNLMLGAYLLTGLGVTIGYHRLFTHRAFETNRTGKLVLAILGSMAIEGPLLTWVAQHRRHHQHSDRPDDPHSPHLHGEGFGGMIAGIWHAHIGWMFQPGLPELRRHVTDLLEDRLLTRVSNYFPLWVTLGLLIPAALGGLLTMSWTGVLLGFIWGGLVRVFLIHHVTWSINSVCHLWGSQPFDSRDESRNNLVFGILALGEGWHNNHHAFPTSARHGLMWWQLDVSYWIIRGMALIGMAWNIRVPGEKAMRVKQRISLSNAPGTATFNQEIVTAIEERP